MEGLTFTEDTPKKDTLDQLNTIMTLFDAEDKNLAFTQIISTLEERLSKLENQLRNENG